MHLLNFAVGAFRPFTISCACPLPQSAHSHPLCNTERHESHQLVLPITCPKGNAVYTHAKQVLHVGTHTNPSSGLFHTAQAMMIPPPVHVLIEDWRPYHKDNPIYRSMQAELQHHKFVPDGDDAYLVHCT